MTPKAQEFADHNKAVSIVAGKWLPEHEPPEKCNRVRYRFTDGSIRTLKKADVQSMLDAGVKPVWGRSSKGARKATMAENKIVTGMKEALEHAKEHAGCEHLNKEEYGTGRWRCPDCGCVIYKSYADYCDC